MSVIGGDVDLANMAPAVEGTADKRDPLNPRPPMSGLDVSYTTGNQWYAYLPIEDILGKRYKNLDLHLTKFSLPQMEMGSSSVPYKGYSKEIPLKVINPETKQLTLEYLVDEYWQNYKSLFAWQSVITGVLNPVTDDVAGGISPSEYITLRIYLLNNYKKKVLEFEFQNCWLKVFNEISLDVTSQEPVVHSFTFVYDDYRMVEI